MARRALELGAATLVLAATLGPIAAVLFRAGGLDALSPGDGGAIRFTLLQAFLSAGISVIFAVPVARALARRQFPGRGIFVALLGAPFILPVIVAVLGLIATFGSNGIVNRALAFLGLPEITIYGLHGVVIAHVFFNLPLATRLVLQAWLALPGERLRLAGALGLGPWAVFRLIEVPMLARILPGVFAVIFVICLSSFAVALTLGGGPRATTVELAIYQAMRFDFDLGRAATLSLVQLGLALGAGLVALRLATGTGFGVGLDRAAVRWDSRTRAARSLDTFFILAAAAFLLTPLGLVVARGLPGLALLGAGTWEAFFNSVWVALASTALCMLWALPLATRRGELIGLLGIAISPLVLGTGLFLILRAYVNPFSMALPVTMLVNALVSLPFALRVLRPEAEAIRKDYRRLADSLGMTSSGWVWLVLLPRLRRPMGFACGLTAALSMGDLGVIALFADPDRATLPLQVFRLMGSYQMEAAQGAALLLVIVSFALFWLFDRGGRVDAET